MYYKNQPLKNPKDYFECRLTYEGEKVEIDGIADELLSTICANDSEA